MCLFGGLRCGRRLSLRRGRRAPRLAGIVANDNTIAGGKLDRGTLHIALVARRGLWTNRA